MSGVFREKVAEPRYTEDNDIRRPLERVFRRVHR